MGRSLLNLPVFESAIDKCQRALKPHGVDVINIITSDEPRIYSDILNCFVAIAACQVCFPKLVLNVSYETNEKVWWKF
jgi:fatty acid synthase